MVHVIYEHQAKKDLEILGLEVVSMWRMVDVGILQYQLQWKSLDLD